MDSRSRIDQYETIYSVVMIVANQYTTIEELKKKYTFYDGAELDDDDTLTTTTYFKRNIIVNKAWRGDTGANTRHIKIKTSDLIEKILPELNHEPTIISL